MRPRDYVLGKLAGLGVLMAALIDGRAARCSPGLRLGLCDVVERARRITSRSCRRRSRVGALATLAFAAVPLGFSALRRQPAHALALWAAYYLVGGTIAIMIGAISHTGWIAALDLPTAIEACRVPAVRPAD